MIIGTAPTEVAAERAQSVTPAPLPVVPVATGPPRFGIWRRVNVGAVIAVLLYVFLDLSAQTFYIRDYGNVPLPLLKLSLVGSGVVYSVAAVVVGRFGRRHSVLIWLAETSDIRGSLIRIFSLLPPLPFSFLFPLAVVRESFSFAVIMYLPFRSCSPKNGLLDRRIELSHLVMA